MRCFVTVGTTRFDALVEAVLDEKNLIRLQTLGFRELSLQPGNFDIEAHLRSLEYVKEISNRNGIFYAKACGLNVGSLLRSFVAFSLLDTLEGLFPYGFSRDA